MTKDQIEKAIADAEALTAKLREMLPIEPIKPRFAVGDQVRIIGPSVYGRMDLVGIQVAVDYVSRRTSNLDVNLGDAGFATYHASSLAPIAEVPAPKFKRGDKVVYTSAPEKPFVLDHLKRESNAWLWKAPNKGIDIWYSESVISPAKPSYLPTRYIYIGCEKDHDGFYVGGYVTETEGGHTHLIHDMPADKDDVQVDFVTLTEAGYVVAKLHNSERYFCKSRSEERVIEYHATAIDAWRAAAVHYLANKK